MKNTLSIVLLAILVLFAYSCSDDDDGGGTTTTVTITSIDPGSAYQGDYISIIGSGFGSPSELNYVSFGGVNATYDANDMIQKWTDVLITIKVPGNSPAGSIKIKVVVSGSNSNEMDYTIKEVEKTLDEVLVQSGTFMMGSDDEDDLYGSFPKHSVTLTRDIYVSKYEITQKQYEDMGFVVSGNLLEQNVGDNKPIVSSTWIKAIRYCNALSIADGLTPCYTEQLNDFWEWDMNANGYRLPTEAEWEYICRAGETGDYAGPLSAMAWYDENSNNSLHDVGTKDPNGWGIYDLNGNAAEWCWDWFDSFYYEDKAYTDPVGPDYNYDEQITEKVYRGGSYLDPKETCRVWERRSLSRSNSIWYVGFRVVRNAN